MTKRILVYVFSVLAATNFAQTNYSDINELISKGDYTKAQKMITLKIAEDNMSATEKYELMFQADKLERIRKDFNKTAEDILKYIKEYYSDDDEIDLEKWENKGSLEFKIIDGQKYYFNRAASNLFRINKEAKARKLEVDGQIKDRLDLFLESYLPEIVQQSKKINSPFVNEKKMRLNYNLIVNADIIPEGEIIRCWLPFPREKENRQKDIKLISINNDNYILSPKDYSHRTIYSEKKVKKGKPTEFKLVVEFTGVNEWHKLENDKLKPYNKNSSDYKTYTSERPPHIVFTDRVKMISQEIVGDETNKLLIAKKIFKWINDNIPWAGALEYSTIQNISDYCLLNGHGDCGIKTITFITLARYNGIPARWESGLMLHPNNWNLHDWGEIYFEGIGWVPVDQSFGLNESEDKDVKWFFLGGNDAYHFIINDDFGQPLYPAKIFPRSETVDFQRGEVEWKGGNLYFDKWNYDFSVEYLD